MTFRNNRLEKLELPVSSLWLLTHISTARERLLTCSWQKALAALAEARRNLSAEGPARDGAILASRSRNNPGIG
jgi:hypothetical protein